MKKLFAVLLCVLLLASSLSMLSFAEYPVEGRDEPSVETAVENTIGKYIPTGKAVSDAVFNVLNQIHDAFERCGRFLTEIVNLIITAMQSINLAAGRA